MDFKNIILIFNSPALNTDIQTYSLWELIELGFKVTILDASPFLMPEANCIVTAKRISDERFESHICSTKKELEFFVKKNAKSACFIPMFNSYYDVRFVFKLFTKYKVFYGHVTTARTEFELPKSEKIKREWKNSRINPCYVYKALYTKWFSKIIKYQKAKFIILGGRKNEDLYIKQNHFDENTKIIRIHTFDYERFLQTSQYNYDKKSYCLYLDQYFPFHPDLVTNLGINFTEQDKKEFVTTMNNIFDHIRKCYDMDIIIAAHPRANYSDKEDLYPNTLIEYGKTAELIKGASLVIANFSNSIFFAVMQHLPLIIVNSSVIKKIQRLELVLKGFANLTGALVVENESELPAKFKINVDNAKYSEIENDYFKSKNITNKYMWEYIANEI